MFLISFNQTSTGFGIEGKLPRKPDAYAPIVMYFRIDFYGVNTPNPFAALVARCAERCLR